MTDAESTSPPRTGRREPLAVGLAALAVLVAALCLRYGLIEPRGVELACLAAGAPWWCAVRLAAILAVGDGALGWISLGGGVLTLVSGRRLPAAAGLLAGAAGVVLYATGLSAVGIVLALAPALRR